MIFIAGTFISFFLAVLLLLTHKKSGGDIILLSWLVVNSLHQLLFYFDMSGYSAVHPVLAGLNIPFALLHGPFLFLYVSAFVHRLPKRKIWYFIHFMPFIISYTWMLPFYLLSAGKKLHNLHHGMPDFGFLMFYQYNTVLLSGTIYIFLSVIFLIKFRYELKKRYFNLGKNNMQWLLMLISSLLLVWIVIYFGNITHIFIVVGINTMLTGIVGIRHTVVFTGNTPTSGDMPQYLRKKPVWTVRYEKSGLTAQKKQLINEGLQKLMAKEKIYNDSNLSLDMLANRLNIHPNYLSQYINEELKISFYDYINSYRVEEFKKLVELPGSNNYKILALAYECGFNSKSSFNRNFKKATGYTPSEYLRNLNK
jgi:AraC-like DNA-binding protein